MTELDVFDARLTRAYRRYLAEAPTEVDAVALAHSVVGARQRRVLTWPWPRAGARVLAWLVILGLLVALAAAALYVGSRPPSLLAGCLAGSQPDSPGPAEQARPPYAYVQPSAFDAKAHRIVLHATATWTFDVCANTWTRMRAANEPPDAQSLVYDADSDLTLAITSGGWMWAYNYSSNSWTRKSPVPGPLANFPRLVYDPTSRLVVAQSAGSSSQQWQMWTYRVESDTWKPLAETGAPTEHGRQVIAFVSALDRIVAYDGETPATWLFDMGSGRWSSSGAATPQLTYDWYVSGGEIAYDAAQAKTVAFSTGRLITYDAAADRWDTVLDPAPADAGLTWIGRPSVIYDSVNKRLVVYGSEYATPDGWNRADGVLAFDVGTGEWRTLLAATAQKIPN